MPAVPPDPVWVFISAFGISAFAGLAALLRSGTPLTRTNICSSLLNSGILGLGISLLWYAKYQEDLIGVCVLAGLGGMTTVDFFLRVLRKGGLSIRMGKNGEVEIPDPDEKSNEK
jgi:hypothetical protein